MRKRHEIVVSRDDTDRIVKADCAGKGCPLCASTAENRARISFVRPR